MKSLAYILILVSSFSILYSQNQSPYHEVCNPHQSGIPYSINQPDSTFLLSYELTEISGISILDNNIYAIQDELGVLFQLDNNYKIKKRYRFAGRGDFEGLTRDENNFYALTSDGIVYQIPFENKEKGIKLNSQLPISCNFEGIVHINKHLFVIAKGNCDDDKYPGKARCLFDLDLEKNICSLRKEFSYKEIKKLFNLTPEGIPINNKIFPYQKPKPSGLAFDQVNKEWYILNDSGKALFRCDSSGNLINFALLDPALYPQPEGIVFDQKGNLYISNEGINSAAILHKITRQAKN